MCVCDIQNGGTGFIESAQNGHLEVVKLLLDKGADVNQANEVSACVCVRACACAFVLPYLLVHFPFPHSPTLIHTKTDS